MTVLLGLLLAAALAAAAFFAVRYFLLKRSLRRVDRELGEIVEHIGDNRIVRLPQPDPDLEALLSTVNHALEGIRYEAVRYARRETELKEQIEQISHDLRTPLTSIVGYLALLDDAALDAETRASLETVRRKADALQRLVGQFYELSRVRGESFSLEVEAVDVGRTLRESVASRYRLLAARGLDVRPRIPEHPVCVSANADALERVFDNLLHNAGKYAKTALEVSVAEMSAEGGARDGIASASSTPAAGALAAGARRVVVVLANDTDALDEDTVARLFQPFYMVDEARTQESSGLGLAIARHLLERMGGRIEARLEDRAGVTWLRFEIMLDVYPGKLSRANGAD